jgi:hypothetical protein
VGDASWPSGLARTATKNRLLALCWALGSAVWSLRSSPTRTDLAALGVYSVGQVRRQSWAAGSAVGGGVAGGGRPRALLCPEAQVARQVLADDLVLLVCLDAQIVGVEAKLLLVILTAGQEPASLSRLWSVARAV